MGHILSMVQKFLKISFFETLYIIIERMVFESFKHFIYISS